MKGEGCYSLLQKIGYFLVNSFDNTEGIIYNCNCLEKINFRISTVRSHKLEVYFYETKEKGAVLWKSGSRSRRLG